MARYKANAKSFIGNRIVEAGEEVDYDGVPGTNLDPLDDEAQAAKDEADAARKRRGGLRSTDGRRPIEPFAPLDIAAKRALVVIPDNWREQPPEQRINLARRLGAPVKGTGAKQADTLIETELANRATK